MIGLINSRFGIALELVEIFQVGFIGCVFVLTESYFRTLLHQNTYSSYYLLVAFLVQVYYDTGTS